MKQYVSFLALLLFTACDPCADCGLPLTDEPTAEMVFINQKRINEIEEVLVNLDSLDSTLTVTNELLGTFQDSLERIQDSIAKMLFEYLDEEVALLDTLSKLKPDSAFLSALNLSDSISDLSTQKDSMGSGNLLISKIKFPEINDSLVYSDGDEATSWSFPLAYEKEFTIYEVLIEATTYTIELDYEPFLEVDKEQNVTVTARDIEVIHTVGFDSLIQCEQNCIDGEAIFTFYF